MAPGCRVSQPVRPAASPVAGIEEGDQLILVRSRDWRASQP
jgi:hypothetical protein